METDAGSQLVENIDRAGRVIAIVPRSQIRQDRLRHRCTYVVVVDSNRRLVVHRRADWKDVYPGWWDVAFGGVCSVGEDWVGSARRELAEEAGIVGVALWPLGMVSYDGPDGSLLGQVYVASADDEHAQSTDGEAVEFDRVPLATMKSWLACHQVCLDSRQCVVPLLGSAVIALASRATASGNRWGSPEE